MSPSPVESGEGSAPARQEPDWRWRSLDVVMRLAFPVILGISSWAGMAVLDHESRLDVIEATRYTRDDAAAAREKREGELRAVLSAIADLRTVVERGQEAAKAASVATGEIKQRLDRIEDELRKR